MGSGKSSSSQKRYNRFGTIPGATGRGPFEALHKVFADGKLLWEGTITRGAEAYVDLTSLIDASNFMTGGYLHYYWGTADQEADAYLGSIGHPPYKDTGYFIGRHFLFGLERGSPREMKIELSSIPVCPTSIVEADDNTLHYDGQCNPVAAAAEVLLMLGLPEATFNQPSWRTAGHKAWLFRGETFCSPLVKNFGDARDVLIDLLAMVDGALRWDAEGKLEFVLRAWGEDPGEVPFFDARHYAAGTEPEVDGLGLSEVPTGFDVQFVDRDKDYKEDAVQVPNAWAIQQRQGDVDRRELVRPFVTRRTQAAAIGAQAVRQSDQPRPTAEITLRSAEVAMTAGAEPRPLLPGDKAYFDLDPVPGGDALGQLCIIEERTDRPTGEVVLKVTADTLSPSVPYTPGWTPPEPQDAEADPIEHALVIPLPPSAWALPLAVAVLATRPERNTTGMRVFFDNDDGGDFPELAVQTGFAARATLATAADLAAGVLRLALTDGADGPDAYLAGLTPESEVAARADKLLAVLANVDEDGRVVIDADGRPELEFVSIIGRTAVSAGTHDYTVLRARRGLPARDWTTDAQVWILPLDNITPLRHPDMSGLLASGDPGYIRLTAFTPIAEDDTPEIPQRSFVMPAAYDVAPRIAWTSPAGSSADTDGDGDITISGEVTDRQGDLCAIRIDSRREDGTSETTHLDQGFPATGSRPFSLDLNFAGDATLYRVYVVRLEARDQQGYVAIQSRTIVRPPSGTPATPPPPGFAPADGWTFRSGETVFVTAASGAQVEYLATIIGAAAPASGFVAPGNEVMLGIISSRRIWARARVGSDVSPWVCADYYKEGISGGGPIEP